MFVAVIFCGAHSPADRSYFTSKRMKDMGNVKSNMHYNPDEIRNPLPTNMIEQERDSDLEKYIRGM